MAPVWSDDPQDSEVRPSGWRAERVLEDASDPGCSLEAPCWTPGLVSPRLDRASREPSGSTIMSMTEKMEQIDNK